MVGVDERNMKESATWNHMKKVVQNVNAERPSNPVDVFETQSHYINTGKALPTATTSIYMDCRPRDKQLVADNQLGRNDAEWATNFSHQYAPVKAATKATEDGDDPPAEDEEEEDKGELPDVVTEQLCFNNFGEGLPETESFRVMVGMKRLLDKEPLAKVRFWGKVTGVVSDYYVVEAKIDEARVPEKDVVEEDAPELVGKPPESIYQGLNNYRAKEQAKVQAEDAKGVNEFKFYVSNTSDPTNWTQLPDVMPNHIIAARQISKLLSGSLDAPVDCHPPFPGNESHYLRAQIARISHGTLVCPKDIYSTDVEEDAEEELEEGEEPKPKRYEVKPFDEIPAQNTTEAPDAEDPEAVAPLKVWFLGFKHDELLECKYWVHSVPQMLQEGRVTKFKSEDEDASPDEEEDTNAPTMNEWINPFLADLGHDATLALPGHSKAEFPAWALRKAYHNASNCERVYLARSLRWPGAYCYAVCEDDKSGATYQNLYVGNGIPNRLGQVFVPTMPSLPGAEFPVPKVQLQKDCTRDDELEFEPAPVAQKLPGEEGEEGEEED